MSESTSRLTDGRYSRQIAEEEKWQKKLFAKSSSVQVGRPVDLRGIDKSVKFMCVLGCGICFLEKKSGVMNERFGGR